MRNQDQIRTIYIGRYGQDAWTRAGVVASRQRSRALRTWGLTEHFTACEWLDLCAQTDFGCARCGHKVQLSPHHRIQLSTCGSNTIGNIEPLCEDCHFEIPILDGFRNVRAEWLAEQLEMYQRWKKGDLVQIKSSDLVFGVVVSTTPPILGNGPLYGHLIPQEAFLQRQCLGACSLVPDEMIVASGVEPPFQTHYGETTVHVKLPGGDIIPVWPRGLTPVELPSVALAAQKWVSKQWALISEFKEGDMVAMRGSHGWHGVIIEIVQHRLDDFAALFSEDQPPARLAAWVPGTEAQAMVAWEYSGIRKMAPKVNWVYLKRLRARK